MIVLDDLLILAEKRFEIGDFTIWHQESKVNFQMLQYNNISLEMSCCKPSRYNMYFLYIK